MRRLRAENLKRRVYISGPITGMPGLNREAFSQAAGQLSAAGKHYINPLDIGRYVRSTRWTSAGTSETPTTANRDGATTWPQTSPTL